MTTTITAPESALPATPVLSPKEKVAAAKAEHDAQVKDGTTAADQKQARYRAGRLFGEHMLSEKPYWFWDQNVDRWFEYLNGAWVDYSPATMGREHTEELPSAEHQDGYRSVLYAKEYKRGRKGQTFDFDIAGCAEKHPHLINRAVIDKWISPIAGQYHEAFDWLLETLSSGRTAEREHIEQCIYWKHKNPAEFKMPALVLYGGAGNGKGVLVEHVLKNIFTLEHWNMVSGGAARLMKFQDSLAGRAIFLFDEANFRAHEDHEWIKAIIGKEHIEIEPKGLKPYTAKMQTWFHIANNSPLYSPVPAAGNDVDRRFSFIRTRRVLWQTIAEKCNLGPVLDDHGQDNATTKAAAYEVMNTILMPDAFTNRTALAAFLQYLYAKYDGKITNVPAAFHGEDYRALLENAQTTEDAVCEDVFVTDADFLCISEQALYNLYVHRAKLDGIKDRFIKSKQGFKSAAADFIDRKKLPIINDRVQRYHDLDGRRSPCKVFVLIEREGRRIRNNDSHYSPEYFEPAAAEDAKANDKATPKSAKVLELSRTLRKSKMEFNDTKTG